VPPENVKGDVARILFYMVLTYDYLKFVELETETLHQMGVYSTLLNWHFLDLPDEFEINRNNIIASYQGNRNPFVDYPLF
jgi:endonuclease I